jgi:2-succinyl-6-hydroxy-2,4-cyclohexadiene-1-carboxylate synthase
LCVRCGGHDADVDSRRQHGPIADPLVLLHGFTQTGRSWAAVQDALRERAPELETIAPDLRGHGSAAGARPIDTASLVADVLALTPGRFLLAGYSMGGRLALQVALAAPNRVRKLVLVSATPGLSKPDAAAERRAADAALADELERDGIEAFTERWSALPLWAGQPPEVRDAADAERLEQDPAGLAASLRGFGTGSMTAVWDRLTTLRIPVTIIVGSEDEKFRATARRMHKRMKWAKVVVVAGAGHALPLEAPRALAREIVA